MRNFLIIAAFTAVVSLFYTVVGNLLPQLESRPPAELKVGDQSLSDDDLLTAGAGAFEANCAQCHKFGSAERCPDMTGMGTRAKERARTRAAATSKTYDDADYLLESLCRPGDHLVDGFANIMPPQGKALSGGQMLAVVAFLQDQGGTPTISLRDVEKANARLERFGCTSDSGGGAAGAAVAEKEPVGTPESVFTTFACVGCHALDRPDALLGPSLMNVGQRLTEGQLYESVLVPDATVAPGFAPGLMKSTLDANGFYERMTPADYKALVDWLAAKKS